MKTVETKRLEMFIRVGENRQEFPLAAAEGSRGAELFDELGQVVEDVKSSAYEQSRAQSAVRESSANIRAARAELERQLEAIRKTARITGVAGLEDKFLPPREPPDQGLLTLARTYGTDAFSIKADLIKRGLGPDFINDLSGAGAAFDAALNERAQRLGRQVAATAGLNRDIERGLRVVRELGVIMHNVYVGDPAKLALWESVSHVEKAGRRTRHEDDTQPPPPAQS